MDATRNFFNFRLLFHALMPLVYEFRSSLIAAHCHKLRLDFLNKCLQEQVLPKSMLPRRLLQFGDVPFESFHRVFLEKNIQMKRVEVREFFKKSRISKQNLISALPSEWKQPVFDHCYSRLRYKRRILEGKLNNKLNSLISSSKWTTDANHDFVINLSSHNLDNSSLSALGYGLNFSITPSVPNYIDIAESLCNFEKKSNVTDDIINIVKGFIYGASSFPSYSNVPLRFMNVYKKLKNDVNLHITKADKSNAMVILDKQEYNDKMYLLLSDVNTYGLLNSNPLNRVIANYNEKIKEIFKDNQVLQKQFLVRALSLSYLYGLVKTHKPNNPIRPIISSAGSVTYKLSKWLVKLLSPFVGSISNSNIKHNVDLVEKLSNLNINYPFKMISFDVVSLFTKVPVDDLLEYLSEFLSNFDLELPTESIIELIKLCICDSVFTFEDKFYVQKFGMAMGNPLSPVLSNLYMEFFETKFLPNILPRGVLWFRYVDDIFCIWPLIENVNNFLVNLNTLVPSIKFTIEEETDLCLPFLDVKIFRTDSGFKFSVYRKPTNVCSYIHFYSNHSEQIKKSTFATMFLRALRICSPEYIDDEFGNIFSISEKLKYPKHFIECSLRKARRTFYSESPSETPSFQNVLVLPYSDLLKNVPRFCKNFDINVVFRFSNTLKNFMIKNSPKVSNCCIYQIPCKNCNRKYLGQSSKGILARIEQHKGSVRRGQTSNALFLHMNECNHGIDWNKSEVIIYCNNITRRNIIESALIKYNQNLVNVSPGMYKLDAFTINEIGKLFPL